MALTGNELVTVDGLKALHDYNEEAYVKAENGQLYIDTLDGVGHLGFYDDGQVKGEIYTNNTGANEIGMQVINADGKINYISLFAPSDEVTIENALSIVNYENGNYTQKYIYHEGNKPTASDVGAVPLDGSVSMTGDLYIRDYGVVSSSNVYTAIRSTKDESNFRYLRIMNQLYNEAPLANAIAIGNVVDGHEDLYNIFGEHNLDALASAIQSLIDEGKITLN